MRFQLLDRICSYEVDTELTAVKNVSLAEDYLADHFPEFPVLPGVFMLEAATQAGAWLIRLSEDFAHSVIVLQEAKAVKFADFVPPGYTLKMCVTQLKREGNLVHMRFRGEVDGRSCVQGRLILRCTNLTNPDDWARNCFGLPADKPSPEGQSAAVESRGASKQQAAEGQVANRLDDYEYTNQSMIDALRVQGAILTRGAERLGV